MIDINTVKLITLCDNAVGSLHCIGEWGFSVFVEVDGRPPILFDTGRRKAVTYNAETMGIRLAEADKIILSHGHVDHTGGLLPVLECMKHQNDKKKTDIVCHPAAIEPQYSKHSPDEDYGYCGIPYNLEGLHSLGATITCYRDPLKIWEDIIVSGEIPMLNDFEIVASSFYIKRDGEYVRSFVEDDQALFLKTSLGLIIILGCAHRGMVNTIKYAQKITGIEKVYMIIGGTHLVNASERQLTLTVEALKKIRVEKIGVSHCTGIFSALFLAEQLGKSRFFGNTAGTQITFSRNALKIQAFEKFEPQKY